jgi:hypothetical protein
MPMGKASGALRMPRLSQTLADSWKNSVYGKWFHASIHGMLMFLKNGARMVLGNLCKNEPSCDRT